MHTAGEQKQLLQPSGWPTLPNVAAWQDTRETVQLWTQIVGKVRLALAPMLNQWWQVPLYVSARGLTTSLMHAAGRGLEIEVDFLDHELVVRTSGGGERRVELAPRSVADFHAATMTALRDLGVHVDILARPVEIPGQTIPFDQDTEHCSYDPDAIQRFWLALVQAHRVLSEFRTRFIGKASPVHFFWGAFDLAASRFSGRRAPTHPGGVPNCPDWVQQLAYSHEVSSCGLLAWWQRRRNLLRLRLPDARRVRRLGRRPRRLLRPRPRRVPPPLHDGADSRRTRCVPPELPAAHLRSRRRTRGLGPRCAGSLNRAEHVASHDLHPAALHQLVTRAGIRLVAGLTRVPVPLVQFETAATDRIVAALVRPSDEAVERDRHVADLVV